ncbi:MAG: GNAT family N-acetyltransferase [Dehalococcoidia bacterium]
MSFDCGSEPLNEYLQRYARQNHDSGLAKTWVAVEAGGERVLGFYTLTVAHVEFASAPERLRRRFPRYPIPVYRLARLAVARTVQGQRVGAELLLSAVMRARAAADSVGGIGLLIDAKDDDAARWYRRFGATPLVDHPLLLLLPFDVVGAALRDAGEDASP